MHSALLIVEPPTPGHQEDRMARRNFKNGLIALAHSHRAIEILGAGCALISLDRGADALADVLSLARNGRHVYRVLFFEKEPAWVRSVPAANPNR